MTYLVYPTQSPVESIGVFQDVDLVSSPPQDGYALLWDVVTEKWKPQSITVSLQTTDDLVEGDNNLYYSDNRVQNYLENTDIRSLYNVNSSLDTIDNYFLIWSNSELVSVPIFIPNLGVSQDVDLSVLSDGQILVWDFSQQLWIPTDLDIPQTTTDLEEGTNKYYTDSRVNLVIESSSLNKLNDVNISDKESGDILFWDGSSWVAQQLTPNTPQIGDSLTWDGTKWVASRSKELTYTEINSNQSISANIICGVDTTNSEIIITLPSSAQEGDKITIFDLKGSDPLNPTGFGLNQVSIQAISPQTIQGYSSLELNQENISLGIIYSSTQNRWSIYQKT